MSAADFSDDLPFDLPASTPAEAQNERLAEVIAMVWDAYQAADLPRALAAGRAAIAAFPAHGECWFAYACVLERDGQLIAADRAFRRAEKAPDDAQPLPCRVSWSRFERAVDHGAAALPPPLKAVFDEVALVLADYAEPELLDELGEAELLGLFVGTPKGETPAPEDLTPRIYLFRRAHEHAARTVRDFDDEVRRTLLHEFGHYLGYDEDGLERLGLA